MDETKPRKLSRMLKKTKTYKRAIRLSLKWLTKAKRNRVQALWLRYCHAVNFFLQYCWSHNKADLNGKTLAKLKQSELSARYRSQALKHALDIIKATRAGAEALGVEASCPRFRGAMKLDAKFVEIDLVKNAPEFDVVLRVSSLVRGKKIVIPTKGTRVLNKWLNQPGARLIQGAALSPHKLVLWVAVPESRWKSEGHVVGCDTGLNKLFALHNGEKVLFRGTKMRQVCARVARRISGSKGKKRARCFRDQYIDWMVNKIPWTQIKTLVVEDLTNLKKGKKQNQGKGLRKTLSPWRYRRALNRIEQRAQENGVRLVRISPANTSRTCPKCGKVSKLNRSGEEFRCIACGHPDDADAVGALNILRRGLRFLGSVESPRSKLPKRSKR